MGHDPWPLQVPDRRTIDQLRGQTVFGNPIEGENNGSLWQPRRMYKKTPDLGLCSGSYTDIWFTKRFVTRCKKNHDTEEPNYIPFTNCNCDQGVMHVRRTSFARHREDLQSGKCNAGCGWSGLADWDVADCPGCGKNEVSWERVKCRFNPDFHNSGPSRS